MNEHSVNKNLGSNLQTLFLNIKAQDLGQKNSVFQPAQKTPNKIPMQHSLTLYPFQLSLSHSTETG